MKNILPINSKPSVITCIHYAYPCAIIESNEMADISIEGFEQGLCWKEKVINSTTQINSTNIKICEVQDGCSSEAVIWREFSNVDEVCIQINYMKPRDFSRYIDLFLFTDDLMNEIQAEDKTCGIRWNPYGLFIGKEMYDYDTEYYNCIRIRKGKNTLSVFTARNGKKWKLVDHLTLPEKYQFSKLNVGIHLYFGEDYYEYWKNANFVQLIYNKNNPYKGISLDYYFFPRKNMDNSYLDFINFLETHYDTLYDALDAFKSINKYICWNVDHGYYINICLDELYIPGRGNYRKCHYSHYNLVYGYDDEKQVFLAMGYGVHSTPVVSEIPYNAVCVENITSKNIVRYKYKTNDNAKYVFDIAILKNSLEEFLYNKNSGLKVSNLLTQEDLIYGVDVIKNIAETEIEKVKNDRRIAFCLLEHSKIMRGRIEFLFKHDYLQQNDYKVLKEQIDDVVHGASVLQGMVIKNRLVKVEDDRFKRCLFDIYQGERRLVCNLLKRM